MKIITVSKVLLNTMSLPGMGRSIELIGIDDNEAMAIHQAYQSKTLYVEFAEEPGNRVAVRQIWANPHSAELTLFV